MRRRRLLHRELDNLVAGANRSGEDAAGGCCLAAMAVMELTGPLAVGADLAAEVLGRGTLSASIRRRLVYQRGNLLLGAGKGESAREHYESGEALLRDVGDPLGLGLLLCAGPAPPAPGSPPSSSGRPR